MEQFVTVTQAADALSVTSARIRQMVAEGLLREAGRAGTAILLYRADVERLADEGWPGRRTRRPIS